MGTFYLNYLDLTLGGSIIFHPIYVYDFVKLFIRSISGGCTLICLPDTQPGIFRGLSMLKYHSYGTL